MHRKRQAAAKSARGKPAGSVRIIGGTWRGRRLTVIPDSTIRPTPDRIRETLFNWLQPVLPGMRCLDLFAGTGALGLEALSRGAAESWFVDDDPRAAAAIEAALGLFGGNGRVIATDAHRLLGGPCAEPFHLVFLDPPFEGNEPGNLCTLLDRGWLADDAWIYLEMSQSNPVPDLPAGWQLHRQGLAGGVRFALARRRVMPAEAD